jgi:hypothetical protein
VGLFSLVGSLFGGGAQKKASKQAEAAQLQYLQDALGEQRRQYDTTRADYQPYLETGKDALGGARGLVGLDGADAQGSAIAALKDSPLFKSMFNTGEEALLQNASATGGIRGGNTQRGLADFGSDTLARVIEEQYGKLAGLAGLGIGATGGAAQAGQTSTQNITNILGQQGQVRAGGILTRGGITSSMWNNAGQGIDSIISSIMGGMGGGGGGGFNPSSLFG